MLQHITTGDILKHLSELRNYPNKALAPYEEFKVGASTYYFTPGGSLCRKDLGKEGAKVVFDGHLPEEG
jgi:hypothetical protein